VELFGGHLDNSLFCGEDYWLLGKTHQSGQLLDGTCAQLELFLLLCICFDQLLDLPFFLKYITKHNTLIVGGMSGKKLFLT